MVSGNPIRKSFITSGINDYRKRLEINPTDFVVLCFGGSRGAGKINNVMSETAETLYEIPRLNLFFITGIPYYDTTVKYFEGRKIECKGKINILPYADNIHEYLFAADLVISRSGALTVSEITACGRPSVLIPSPNVTGNHQYYNAKVVADKGGAVIIEEKDLTAEKLTGTILRLMNNKEALNAMAAASASVGRIDGADVIYDHLGLEQSHFPPERHKMSL